MKLSEILQIFLPFSGWKTEMFAPTTPGVEWTLGKNRAHWSVDGELGHWTLGTNRAHWALDGGPGHWSLGVNRAHWTLDPE